MILTKDLLEKIVKTSARYLGTPFDFETFNCVHFVRAVYKDVDIDFPLLDKKLLPPREFHLSIAEFNRMPQGHSVFFRKKISCSHRPWTHVAIIVSQSELIHCTRNIGNGVVITPRFDFLEIYDLAPCH